MGVTYDEYLEENPFFQEIQESHRDLLEKASSENWIICIPRLGTFQRTSITIEDILQHILVPNTEQPETRYTSLSKRSVCVRNNIIILQNDLNCYNSVHILFKETFYVEKLKFSLWCIEFPLNQSFVIHDPSDLTNIINIRDCIHLLCAETSGRGTLEKLSSTVEEFVQTNRDLEGKTVESLKTRTDDLYRNCLGVIFKNENLRQKTNSNAHLLEKIYLAVETYMQNCLQGHIFDAVCANTAVEDAELNKTIRNLHDLQLRDFAIHNKFYDNIPAAKCELNNLNNVYTILGKVNCLKRTFNILSDKENQLSLSADDLLQIFVFLIIKISVNNWLANLRFLNDFRFSSLNSSDESSFLITTLEAAIEYIRSGNLYKELMPKSDHFYLEFEYLSEEKTLNKKSLHKLFEAIHGGKLGEVQKLIVKKLEVEGIKKAKLCHPLCSCDNCETSYKQKDICTVDSVDDRGRTPLHIACLKGDPDIIGFLLDEGANLNSTDSSGGTPLHYAVLRGFQHAAFLLIHAGADINASDLEGNTPLHLATNNGHENCVKALVYSSENSYLKLDIDCRNNAGNTPLHLASRWGFFLIVQVLLQFGALVDIRNNKKQLPLDVAHNIFMRRLLSHAAMEQKKTSSLKSNDSRTTSSTSFSEDFGEEANEICENQNGHKFGVRPKNIEEMKKCELLLKAIEKNDMPLTRYYLGMHPETTPQVVENKPTCHPLCTCSNCQPNDVEDKSEPVQEMEKMNVNLCNLYGYTALHEAAKHGRLEILRLLLDSGALITIETYKSRLNVMHIASYYNHLKIIKELLTCGGADINVQDNFGNTPLHFAAMMGNDKVLEFLLKNGANPDVKNMEGKSPLQTAQDRMNLMGVKILRMYRQQEYAQKLQDKYLD